jgi:O-antigen/teichoic acid export membrane protein
MFKAALVFGLIEILGTVYNKTNVFFLERATGVKGVAYYSATWNIVDPVSVLASEQLLGWVIFPLLAALWAKNREGVGPLVKNSAQWLMALAFPVMFVLYAEAPLIIGLVYPSEFAPAVDMQRMLVWTIVLSFENNLFAYVMMTAGAARLLLAFAACSTLINLALNVVLVERFGLMGGCLVIIFTKLIMTVLTYAYCSMKLKILRITDFVLPKTAGNGGVS